MALRAAPALDRKQDVRGELADCRVELAVHRVEELVFIRRVRADASVVLRLLVNDQLAEAASVLGGLAHAAGRRLSQVTASDDETSAA